MELLIKKVMLCLLLAQAMCCAAQQDERQPVFTDSLSLKLDSAEAMFLRNNFLLLAQKYNVSMATAQVVQARLYPNPNFSFATVTYNHDAKQVAPVPFSKNGEVIAGLSQLIILAGKRNKEIKLAQSNVQLTEYQFFDLVRTLKYTLRTDFFNIYYLQQSAKVYDNEIKALNEIVAAFEQQQGKNYIAEKEVIRIKALLYSFRNEYNDLENHINDVESELRQVLQVTPYHYIIPMADSAAIANLNPYKYQLSGLLDTAYLHRSDLLVAKTNTTISKLNYQYQKALALPDVAANLSYDQQGSYIKNLPMAGIAIDLPFFNRNQGNIAAAKSGIAAATSSQKSIEASVEESVFRALQKAIDQDKLYRYIDNKFLNDFDRLMKEVFINYQKRNISILDFLDFYDSYKQNALQVNTIRFNRVAAFEDINFYTGNNFFN